MRRAVWMAMALLIAGPTPGVAAHGGPFDGKAVDAQALDSRPPISSDIDAAQQPRIDEAFAMVSGGHPEAALARIDVVLTAYQAAYAKETRKTYCGMSTAQTLAYMALAASQKYTAVALGPGYCTALFIKGYALIDLKRLPEARAVYTQVVALAPMNAHFLTELGQSYRLDRNWPKMLELCTTASDVAELSSPDKIVSERGFAWRCMGYALTEQGKFDDAEALYRKCLDADPSDAKAKSELSYIAGQRRKKS